MSIKANFNKKIVLFTVDSILFFLALFLALFIRRYDIFEFDYFLSHIPRFFILYIYIILGLFIAGLYEIPQFNLKIKKIKYILYIISSYVVFGTSYFYLLPSEYSPKTVLIIQAGLLSFFIIAWRIYSKNLLKSNKKVKALILDKTEDSNELRNELFKNDYGIEVAHHIELSIFDMDKNPKQVLVDTIHRNKIDIIIADLKNEKLTTLLPHIYTLSGAGVKLYDLKNMYQYVFRKMPLSGVGYFWFYESVSLDTKVYEFVKRVTDIILCVPIFCVWFVLHPWTAYKIKQEDDGEVYSIQERIGRYNKTIFIKKYRTMSFTDKGKWLENSENKVTKIGKFLRKSRIDELPQIFSVWRGDLSFIGPRTDIVNLGEKLATEIPYYNLRYSVTPGLSGWAQTNMSFQPRTVQDTIERLKYDLYYVKNRSIFLDIVIILRTIKTVLSREGS